ncbi:MAG: hypothetical protein JRC77_05020, partial [Deltaproteobacteria bacterium]|nr:hypothetical protein [Deltaproteobacteria bacterium]
YGEFRMPVGDGWVDNQSAGGVSSVVDLASGSLGAANSSKVWWGPLRTNPVTGKEIVGFTLPLWQEALALGCRAHDTLSEFAFIGWDIALLAEGPLLIEANSLWDTPAPYQVGQTLFPECVLAHLQERA